MDALNEETENEDLRLYLVSKVESQITVMRQVCTEEKKVYP